MLLYKGKDEAFPSSVEIGGDAYNINADFRNILRILALLKNREMNELERVAEMCLLFFRDERILKKVLPDMFISAFVGFLHPAEPEKDNGYVDDTGGRGDGEDGRRFCYDFDAEEIYAGFLSEYGMDLFEVEFLHWYKFKALLGKLSSESALKKKIELRFMDLKGLEGEALTDASRAKLFRVIIRMIIVFQD